MLKFDRPDFFFKIKHQSTVIQTRMVMIQLHLIEDIKADSDSERGGKSKVRNSYRVFDARKSTGLKNS